MNNFTIQIKTPLASFSLRFTNRWTHQLGESMLPARGIFWLTLSGNLFSFTRRRSSTSDLPVCSLVDIPNQFIRLKAIPFLKKQAIMIPLLKPVNTPLLLSLLDLSLYFALPQRIMRSLYSARSFLSITTLLTALSQCSRKSKSCMISLLL